MFYMFFFLPILSTSRLIICHSCIHLQAITDAVMFVGTGIVLAAFSTITDTVRLVRTGIVLAAFSTITDIVTVRLVKTGTVLAAFSTFTLSGLLEQGLCWLHSVQLQTLSGLSEQGLCWLHAVQLHCQACWNKDCVGCIQYNYTVRLVGTGTVLAAFRQHGAARVCILLLLFTFFCYVCVCLYIYHLKLVTFFLLLF